MGKRRASVERAEIFERVVWEVWHGKRWIGTYPTRELAQAALRETEPQKQTNGTTWPADGIRDNWATL